MKSLLDNLFTKHLSEGNYVISADMGFFPLARKEKNFIDVGNDESCVGSIAEGLVSSGKHVFIYDVCGYIMRNSYSSFFSRNNIYYKDKGSITVFGWGSGFSYDGCMIGHYPLDDMTLAKLFGLELIIPSTLSEMKNIKYYNNDMYIRMYDTSKYHFDISYNYTNSDLYLISHGWILGLLQEYVLNKNIFPDKKVSIIPYFCGVENKFDNEHIRYYTDNIYDENIKKFKFSYYPKNLNFFTKMAQDYIDKNSCIESWFNLKKTVDIL